MFMENLPIFISNNLLMVIAFVVVLIMLFFNLFGARLRGYMVTNPTEATRLINQENAVILDVREDNEYHQGHILNSTHVPLRYLNERINQLEKFKDKPIIAVCRSGHRSGQACSMLKRAGFETVYNLGGGVMAWESANLPLTRK